MFMVLGDIFASLFGGIIITIVLILTLVLLTRVLFPNTSHTPGSLIVIVISFFFFLFQSTLLVGGYKAKGYVRQLETTVSGLSGELLFDQPLQDPIQLKLAADYLSEEYPFLKGFLDDAVTKAEAQLSQHPGGTLVEWFAYGLQYAIHLFILRRFGWLIAGWIVVLCLVGWLTRRESPKATMAPRRNIR